MWSLGHRVQSESVPLDPTSHFKKSEGRRHGHVAVCALVTGTNVVPATPARSDPGPWPFTRRCRVGISLYGERLPGRLNPSKRSK